MKIDDALVWTKIARLLDAYYQNRVNDDNENQNTNDTCNVNVTSEKNENSNKNSKMEIDSDDEDNNDNNDKHNENNSKTNQHIVCIGCNVRCYDISVMSSLLPVSDHIDIQANRNKLEAYQHIKYD